MVDALMRISETRKKTADKAHLIRSMGGLILFISNTRAIVQLPDGDDSLKAFMVINGWRIEPGGRKNSINVYW